MSEHADGHSSDGFSYDVFVSYASADRELVRRFVERFTRAKLRVWWDQRIYEGQWAQEIEGALDASRRVLVFVSKNAVESGYVFVEARRAREKNKLIPIRIDNAPLKFAFEGLLALVQQWSLFDLVDWDGDERLKRLCALCGGGACADNEQTQAAGSTEVRAQSWLDQIGDVDFLAEALAVAVLESEPYATVLSAAEPLRRSLRKLTSPNDDAALSITRLVRHRDKILTGIEAEIFPVRPQRLKITVDCVRFSDDNRSHALLHLVWENLDELRQPLKDWLDTLACQNDVNIRYRVAVAVGVLAQQAFPSAFDGLIGRWALSDSDTMRQTADLALSIAALAPEVEDAVSSVLIKDWSAETASTKQLRAAVEIACGSTGFRLAPQAISVLKRIAQRDHNKLLADARRAVTCLIAMACTSDSDGLFDLPTFLSALVDWAELPSERNLPSHVPMSLFLSALASLPPSDPDGGPSLGRLFEGRRQIQPGQGASCRESILHACARAFKTALSSHTDRAAAQSVLRAWATYQRDNPYKPDPVLRLANAIIGLTEVNSRDHDRVVFLLHHFYSPHDLASAREQATEDYS